jgi:hypothetical protein
VSRGKGKAGFWIVLAAFVGLTIWSFWSDYRTLGVIGLFFAVIDSIVGFLWNWPGSSNSEKRRKEIPPVI